MKHAKNILVGKLERERRSFQPVTGQLGHRSNNSKVDTENVLAKRYKGNKTSKCTYNVIFRLSRARIFVVEKQ